MAAKYFILIFLNVNLHGTKHCTSQEIKYRIKIVFKLLFQFLIYSSLLLPLFNIPTVYAKENNHS
jgi:hypothetical protein